MPIAVAGKGTVVTDGYSKIVRFQAPRSANRAVKATIPQNAPAIPALPETLLRLDLLIQQRCVEVHDLKRLVLSDVGATLQVLRAAGREYCSAEERPMRIEESICVLGLHDCADAISAQMMPQNGWQPAIMQFWEHSRSIAQYCKMIAENRGSLSPDEAYLVGLLHGIGTLPGLLGWRGAGILSMHEGGLRLAQHCSVPACVMEYLIDVWGGTRTSVWTNVVRMAHGAAPTLRHHSRSRNASGDLAHTV